MAGFGVIKSHTVYSTVDSVTTIHCNVSDDWIHLTNTFNNTFKYSHPSHQYLVKPFSDLKHLKCPKRIIFLNNLKFLNYI